MLPIELVLRIFKYLPEKSLRRASRVSRTFYACAYDAGLSISCSIELGRLDAGQLDIFDDVVQYAVPRNIAVRLSVSCFHSAYIRNSAAARQELTLMTQTLVKIMISALPALVSLSFTLFTNNYDLMKPLAHPMPRLQELVVNTFMSLSEKRDLLPLERFTGDAPQLRTVTLWGFLLGSAPAPAFANVTSLTISEDYLTPTIDDALKDDVPLAKLFPRLRRLELGAGHGCELPDTLRLNFAGVSLDWLSIDDNVPLPFLKGALAFDNIPVVRLGCLTLGTWIEPQRDDANFALRLVVNEEPQNKIHLVAVVLPCHRRWYRVYDVEYWSADATLPIATKRGGAEHLTYLRLHNALLHAFLACDTAFPALRRIQVDLQSSAAHPALLWPPDSDAEPALHFAPEHKSAADFGSPSLYAVPCAALETLTIFALDSRVAIVHSRQAAFLGRALGQVARPVAERSVLVLAGVEFAQPEDSALLAQTFSEIQRNAFSGHDSPADYDDGLWAGIAELACIHTD